jgi:hypothetical protein
MCDVGEVLGRDLEEVGELGMEELSTWTAHLRRRREDEELKAELSVLKVCLAIAYFVRGIGQFNWEKMFPLFYAEARRAEEQRAKDEGQNEAMIQRRLMAWAVALGGKIEKAKPKGADDDESRNH